MKHGSVSTAQFRCFRFIQLYLKSKLSVTIVFLFHSCPWVTLSFFKETENKLNFILFLFFSENISGWTTKSGIFWEKERNRKNLHNLRRRFYNLVEFTLINIYQRLSTRGPTKDETSETIVQHLYSLFPCIYHSLQLESLKSHKKITFKAEVLIYRFEFLKFKDFQVVFTVLFFVKSYSFS